MYMERGKENPGSLIDDDKSVATTVTFSHIRLTASLFIPEVTHRSDTINIDARMNADVI